MKFRSPAFIAAISFGALVLCGSATLRLLHIPLAAVAEEARGVVSQPFDSDNAAIERNLATRLAAWQRVDDTVGSRPRFLRDESPRQILAHNQCSEVRSVYTQVLAHQLAIRTDLDRSLGVCAAAAGDEHGAIEHYASYLEVLHLNSPFAPPHSYAVAAIMLEHDGYGRIALHALHRALAGKPGDRDRAAACHLVDWSYRYGRGGTGKLSELVTSTKIPRCASATS